MQDKYTLHKINYALKFFYHLLTESERLALSAFVCVAKYEDKEEIVIVVKGIDEPSDEIKLLLSDGIFNLRYKLATKLLDNNKLEIYANCCPECKKLPATPLAKQCLWCGCSWRMNDRHV